LSLKHIDDFDMYVGKWMTVSTC